MKTTKTKPRISASMRRAIKRTVRISVKTKLPPGYDCFGSKIDNTPPAIIYSGTAACKDGEQFKFTVDQCGGIERPDGYEISRTHWRSLNAVVATLQQRVKEGDAKAPKALREIYGLYGSNVYGRDACGAPVANPDADPPPDYDNPSAHQWSLKRMEQKAAKAAAIGSQRQ